MSIRIQWEITDEKSQELDELLTQTGLKTRTNLMNEALTILKWAIRQKAKGRVIAAVDESSGKSWEVTTPALDAVKNNGAYTLTGKD